MTLSFSPFRSRLLLLTASLFLAQAGLAAIPAAVGDTPVPSLAPLVKKAAPAVVSIATKGTVSAQRNPLMEDPFFRRFFGDPRRQPRQREREVRSAGSGVIVDAKNGYILTNHHVIANADEIEVVLADNRRFQATVVGSDPGTDVAVLQVEDAENLQQMELGNSENIEVGDFVVAIGNPFGLQHTVTSGIISALGRSGMNPGGYEDFIQTDASINPGNSGGALIDLNGELIGINSMIVSRTGGNIGIGFAIPVNMAESIMLQILEFGEVRRGLLGVSIGDMSADDAEVLGGDATSGALVLEVVENSAAEKAGIEVGDVIVKVDEKAVSSASELRATIGLKRSGDSVRIDLIREGKRIHIKAELDEIDGPGQVAGEDIHPGLAGAMVGNFNGAADSFPGRAVLVESVAQGSRAAQQGLRTDDIITNVNRRRVQSVQELQNIAEDQDLLFLSIQRGNRKLLVRVQ